MAIIGRNFDTVLVSNTTTETDIFTFDLYEYKEFVSGLSQGLLGPGQAVKITVAGVMNQNTGASPTVTVKLYFGLDDVQLSCDPSNGFPYFKAEFTILATTPGNPLKVIAELQTVDLGANSGEARNSLIVTTLDSDLLSSGVVRVTADLSVASANFELTKNCAYVEFI